MKIVRTFGNVVVTLLASDDNSLLEQTPSIDDSGVEPVEVPIYGPPRTMVASEWSIPSGDITDDIQNLADISWNVNRSNFPYRIEYE